MDLTNVPLVKGGKNVSSFSEFPHIHSVKSGNIIKESEAKTKVSYTEFVVPNIQKLAVTNQKLANIIIWNAKTTLPVLGNYLRIV